MPSKELQLFSQIKNNDIQNYLDYLSATGSTNYSLESLKKIKDRHNIIIHLVKKDAGWGRTSQEKLIFSYFQEK